MKKRLILGIMAVVIIIVAAVAYMQVTASHKTSVKFGKVVAASGFHLPAYVAYDTGIFAAEGLNVEFIDMEGGQLVKALISNELDFIPIPQGSAQAMLQGATELRYIVGESSKSQWVIVTRQDIGKPDDLRDKVIGMGRPGSADYSEAVYGLDKFFGLKPGDYKIVGFAGETDRIAALAQGSIQGAAVSIPTAAKGEELGMKTLISFKDYMSRFGGTITTTTKVINEKPEVVKKVVRSIIKAIQYIETNEDGTVRIIAQRWDLKPETARIVYRELKDTFSPEMPRELMQALFDQAAYSVKYNGPLNYQTFYDKFVETKFLNEALTELKR